MSAPFCRTYLGPNSKTRCRSPGSNCSACFRALQLPRILNAERLTWAFANFCILCEDSTRVILHVSCVWFLELCATDLSTSQHFQAFLMAPAMTKPAAVPAPSFGGKGLTVPFPNCQGLRSLCGLGVGAFVTTMVATGRSETRRSPTAFDS